MILSRIYNTVKCNKWSLLLCSAIVVVSIRMSTLSITIWRTIDQLLDLDKCPACYGTSACDDIYIMDITPRSSFTLLSYLLGVKNVFFGDLRGIKVVAKKLAHDTELEAFDETFLESNCLIDQCIEDIKRQSVKRNIDYCELIRKEITLDFGKDDESRLRLCPNTDHLGNLFYNIYDNNKDIDIRNHVTNLWTLVKINPEPLVLQILPAKSGWPVPQYFGACGRVVIEEDVGASITAHYNDPWIDRAKIASSLLHAAHMFTFSNEQFGFYLMDISVDNIAIASSGEAKFVDLENIIIVDKNISKNARSEEWYQLQENTFDIVCKDCLVFSSADICSHRFSDHNYYAICQVLLYSETCDTSIPEGLLHSVPKQILEHYSDVEQLIQQCAFPNAPYNRITAGRELKELLDTIISNEYITPK